MNVHIELWQFISMLIALFGAFIAAATYIRNGIDKSLDTRFKGMEGQLEQHIQDESKTKSQLLELERQFLNHKADLPLQYVRREDFIRNQTIIESKLDGLALKLDNNQLRGGNHG